MIMTAAIIVALAVFAVVRQVGNFLVWRYYLDDSQIQERAEGYVQELNTYIFDNKLSVNDTEKISNFFDGRFVDIIIYKDSDLIYAPEWFERFEGEESETKGESISAENDFTLEDLGDGWFSGDRGFEKYLTEEAREEYRSALENILEGNARMSPIYCIDGTLLVTVVDYSEDFVYNLILVVSIVISIALIAVIMAYNLTRLASRITRLANNVKSVEEGDLDMPIHLDGEDEIASLASDVNSMRNAVIDNMTKERQAWEANSSLITAMSHDIRTPLTVLLGYLDLMEFQNTDAANAEYISVCKENALRLKRLSDDMFSYFLVFGKKQVFFDMNETNASESIEYMIAEHEILLQEKNYKIEREKKIPDVLVNIDTIYFGRVIDNIFSNIGKYADPREPIAINAVLENDKLRISFENKIKKDGRASESNRIGVKTCVKIIEQMGGAFEISEGSDIYRVDLTIPVISMEERNVTVANT